MKNLVKFVVILAALGLVFTGCGDKKAPAEKKDEKKVEKKDEAKKDEAKKDEAKAEEPKAEEPKDEAKAEEPKAEEPKDEAKAEEPKVEEPKADVAAAGMTAEETVNQAVKFVSEGNVYGLWQLLPPTYRTDIVGLVKIITTEMDKEVYEKSIATLDRMMTGIANNKDKIAGQIVMFAPEAPKDQITEAITGLVDGWNQFKALGLNNYDTFAAFDLEAFLKDNSNPIAKSLLDLAAKSGNPEAKAFLDGLKAITVKTEKEEGDVVRLEITAMGDTENVEMVKVEGMWIPKDMAKDWDEVKEASVELKKGMDELKANKAQILATMGQLEPMVAQFETSGDIMMLMGLMGGMGPAPAMDAPEAPEMPEAAPAPEAAPEAEVAPAPEAEAAPAE